MNHILALQAENKALKEQLAALNADCSQFMTYLHSDKFVGWQADGSRKDLVSVGEVINIMREFRMQTIF